MWKFFKYSAIVLCALVVIAVVLFFVAKRAWQHEATWYAEAVSAAEPEVQQRRAEAGDEFERQALDLRNEARRQGQWEAVFTDAQINGWLAMDLNAKHPDMLPSTVHDPRVKFEQDMAQVAFRVVTKQVESVIIVGVDLYLTENDNELAVRFREAHAGLLPVPMKKVIDIVNKAAVKTNIPVTWSQNEGDPVSLIQIPEIVEQIDGRLLVEHVEVRDGSIYLSGRTVRPDGSGGSTNVQRVIVSQLFTNETNHR